MKMCQAHWDELREAIRARGLWKHVAQGGEEVAKRLEGGGWEPLMSAHMRIVANALEAAGLGLMMPNEDGSPRCPICHLVNGCACGLGEECHFRKWITRAADGQLAYAKEKGLEIEATS